MRSGPAVPPTEEVESGLGALLRVEEDLARELREARERAQEIVARAREEASRLRQSREGALGTEIGELETAATRELERELAALEAEHGRLLERYRGVRGERLEKLARWAAERLVADLEEPGPEEGPT